jgi:hypothetical protein
MSTKTTFKRIALVAVAALGLGVVSVAPSSAAIISVTVTPSATTSAIKTGETATISLTVSAILSAATDTVTVHGVRTKGTSGTVNFNATTDSTTTRISGSNYATLGSNAYTAGSISLDSETASSGNAVRAVLQANFVAPSTAGTYEVTLYSSNKGTVETTSKTPFVWTITVTADSALSDSSSTAYINSGVWDALVDADETVIGSAATSSTIAGTIKVTQKNATSSATEAMQAYVTGPGFIVGTGTDSSTASGQALVRGTTRVLAIAAPAVGASTYIGVYSDGTAGVATVTVVGVDSGLVLATKKVTFSSTTPAKVTATVKKAYVAAGKTTPEAIAVSVTDSAGNLVTGATITGTRTDTTTAGKLLASADLTCGSFDTTDLVYYCSTNGASASVFGKAGYKITATGADAAATAVSTTADVTYSDIVATKVTITAPATASIGDKITYTLTATDKNGYPVADTTYEGAYNASALGQFGGILWNTTTVPEYTSTVKPFNAGETITTVNGVATVDVYMPVAAGTVTATWTLAGKSTAPVGAIDATIAGTAITVSTSVVNPGVDAATDAANEATDAANAATDAALAAADAADAATAAAQDASDAVAALSASVSKLISSLRAQITSLTNLVIKIQKKVRA